MLKYKEGALCVLITAAFSGTAIAAPCNGPNAAVPLTSGAPLTLKSALMQVRTASPEIRRAALETRALVADADQAGRRLNPSIGLEVENFSGSGPLSGFGGSETTLSFEQTFELGGKRYKRKRAAQALAEFGAAQCQAVLRELELETSILFYELQAAQELADLAEESASLSLTLSETVAKRVDAGAAAPPELSRASSDAAALKAAAFEARANVNQRRYEMAALWGSDSPKFGPTRGSTSIQLSISRDVDGLSSHPALAAAKAGTEARDAEQDAARAAGIPDLTLSAGLRRFEDTGDNAFLVGVSVPIPLFDRNKDAVRASRFRADSARINAVAAESRLRLRQKSARSQISAAQDRLSVLETQALPAARAAYEASAAGYAAGRFDLTTTLDARKGLIEAGAAVIEARRTFNTEIMRLNNLNGSAPFDGDF